MKKCEIKGPRKRYIPLVIVLNLVVIFHFCNYSLYAKDKFYWLNVGLGLSSFEGYSSAQSSSYISLGTSFSYQTGLSPMPGTMVGSSLISIRAVSNVEFDILFGLSPPESVWDVGVLYGRSLKASYAMASISGGIGIIGGVRRGKWIERGKRIETGAFWGEYERLTFSTVGLPIEIQLFLTPFSSLGIGIYGFANLNKEASFAGVLLCVQIGKLREK